MQSGTLWLARGTPINARLAKAKALRALADSQQQTLLQLVLALVLRKVELVEATVNKQKHNRESSVINQNGAAQRD